MKYDFKLFSSKTELLTYTDLASDDEIQEHMRQCKDLQSLLEPYIYWFGRLNQRFVQHVYKAQMAYFATRQMFHLSYLVFAVFFAYMSYNKEFLPDWLYLLAMYVFMPLLLLIYYPSKKRIEFDFAQTNAALFKEQALCSALIHDNLFRNRDTKELLDNFSGGKGEVKQVLEDVKVSTLYCLQVNTRYPVWMKNFIRKNYEIFTNHLFVQPDSNKLIHENYRAVFSHIALLNSEFGDSQQK